MSTITAVRKQLLKEDNGQCACVRDSASVFPVYCDAEPVMRDVLGLSWCEEHSFRGDLLNAGMARGWPALQFDHYAIAAWPYAWFTAALLGTEEYVLFAQETLKEWDQEQQRLAEEYERDHQQLPDMEYAQTALDME